MEIHRTKFVIAIVIVASSARSQELPKLPNFDRRTPIVIAVENVGPAVVNVRAQEFVARRSGPFGNMFAEPEDVEIMPDGRKATTRSLGSGVIIHPDGYVLTNDHVIDGAQRITLQMKSVAGGRSYEAEVINSNVDNDLALLRVLNVPGPLPFALLGDSDAALVGETVIALGNPLGLSSTVTSGILSAKDREVRFEGKPIFKDFLQIDSPIYPGSSGGALLDINGRLIGINTAIRREAAGGIGFAIPSNRVKELVARLMDPSVLGHCRLGFDVDAALNGARVSRIDQEGPAIDAGLLVGDVVTAIDGARITGAIDFLATWLKRTPAATAKLTVSRAGRDVTVQLKPAAPGNTDSVGSDITSLGFKLADITPPIARRFNIPAGEDGVVVTEVAAGTVAAQLALKPGDRVVSFGRYRIRSAADIAKIVPALRRATAAVTIKILRDGVVFSGNVPLR